MKTAPASAAVNAATTTIRYLSIDFKLDFSAYLLI
jgi:hypothetical protein